MKPPAWIAQLADEGRVAYSRLNQDGEQILAQLRALQLVTLVVHNTRRLVVVIDKPGFAQWFQAAYPAPVSAPVPGQRAANIARARKSKSGLITHTAQPLLLRWFSAEPAARWAELTRRCGIVGVTSDRLATLDPPQHWTLLTVENWEPFLALDYAPQMGTIVAVFTGGNIAEAALQALVGLRPEPARALHFGDYDWSGLAIYRRIRAALPQLTLYVPDDLAALFRDFAGHDLLLGQLPLVAQADDPPELREVIALIAQHNAGLEQEIVSPPEL
ncbi:MAG: hypothetical protein OHK0015_03970 [Chloroflexi bacterium OHK40]